MTGKEHNKLLSIFFFVQGGLQLFIGILMTLIYGGIGGAFLAGGHKQEDQMVGGIFVVVAVCIGMIIAAIAAFNLFTGLKLLKERRIGRTLGIIASCFALLNFPLGTALGIYGLWFLIGEIGKNFTPARQHHPALHRRRRRIAGNRSFKRLIKNEPYDERVERLVCFAVGFSIDSSFRFFNKR